MKTLELLANCLKHGPTQEPGPKLLQHLNLPAKPAERFVVAYAPLSESRCFREGLATRLRLPKDADYCVIAETLVHLVDQFLAEVEKGTHLARITGALSNSEFVC